MEKSDVSLWVYVSITIIWQLCFLNKCARSIVHSGMQQTANALEEGSKGISTARKLAKKCNVVTRNGIYLNLCPCRCLCILILVFHHQLVYNLFPQQCRQWCNLWCHICLLPIPSHCILYPPWHLLLPSQARFTNNPRKCTMGVNNPSQSHINNRIWTNISWDHY